MKTLFKKLINIMLLMMVALSGSAMNWTNYSSVSAPLQNDTLLISSPQNKTTSQISFGNLLNNAYRNEAVFAATTDDQGQRLTPMGPNNFSNGSNNQAQVLSVFTNLSYISGIQIRYDNWVTTNAGSMNESRLSIPLTIHGSLEYPVGGGVFYALTFRGQTNAYLDAGGSILSDSIGILISPGRIGVRTFVQAPNATKFPLPYVVNYQEQGSNSLSDKTLSGTITSSYSFGYGPSMLICQMATKKSIVVIGDSIARGQNSGTGTNGNSKGFFFQALDGGLIPNYTLAANGNRLTWISQNTNSVNRFSETFPYCSTAVVYVGINDINNGVTFIQLTNSALQLVEIAKAYGVGVIFCTIAPNTSSSDGWATQNNQTLSPYVTTWINWNTWIRTNGSPYYEVADTVSTRTGYWLSNGTTNGFTTEGLHPTNIGHNSMATAIDISILK